MNRGFPEEFYQRKLAKILAAKGESWSSLKLRGIRSQPYFQEVTVTDVFEHRFYCTPVANQSDEQSKPDYDANLAGLSLLLGDAWLTAQTVGPRELVPLLNSTSDVYDQMFRGETFLVMFRGVVTRAVISDRTDSPPFERFLTGNEDRLVVEGARSHFLELVDRGKFMCLYNADKMKFCPTEFSVGNWPQMAYAIESDLWCHAPAQVLRDYLIGRDLDLVRCPDGVLRLYGWLEVVDKYGIPHYLRKSVAEVAGQGQVVRSVGISYDTRSDVVDISDDVEPGSS